VLDALFLMFLGRIGSLNGLAQTRPSAFWSRRLGCRLPSADTLGRVMTGVDPDEFREMLYEFYRAQKASKAVPAPSHGLITLVVDGHESTSSELRQCAGCLVRYIDVGGTKRAQYYHRYVGAVLVGEGAPLWIDIEPQRAGEDEVAAATRLVGRVHRHLPRAFDVVAGDGLYAQAPFFRAMRALGKDVIAVLKREELLLTREVRELCAQIDPPTRVEGNRSARYWDFEQLALGEGEGVPVRVVRSVETSTACRQRTRQVEEVTRDWLWVTTIQRSRLPTRGVVDLGHGRWVIENEGFNQISCGWALDHVYRHDPVAIEALTLLGMLAANAGQTFYDRDLKPALRRRTTLAQVVGLIAAGIRLGPQARGASP
jgi:hypothetical protein